MQHTAGYVLGFLVSLGVLWAFLKWTRPQPFVKSFFSAYISVAAGAVVALLFEASPLWIVLLGGVIGIAFKTTPID